MFVAGQAGLPILARIHAIQAMGQVERQFKKPMTLMIPLDLLHDPSPEIRATLLHELADSPGGLDSRPLHEAGRPSNAVIKLLADDDARVQFQAAMFLSKHGKAFAKESVSGLFGLLRSNANKDAYLRHAAVMGLVGIGDVESLFKAVADPDSGVRLGALLALRRLASPEAARFLADSDPKVATEAALAIYEAPIVEALPALANMASKPDLTEALTRRAINAANRVGRTEDAQALATVATRPAAPKNIRLEALSILAKWANPPGRDRINGLWRPIDARPSKVAADALRPAVKGLLEDAPDEIRRETIAAVSELGIVEAGPELLALIVNGKGSSASRADAVKALEKLHDPKLGEAVEAAVGSKDGAVRSEGLRVLARLSPERAIPALAKVIEVGSIAEKQKALEVLGSSDRPEADAILASWLDRLIARKIPAAIELELLEAASKKKSSSVTDLLARFEKVRPKDGPIADHMAELEGGNAERGKRIFLNNAAVYCVRCHKVKGEGGEVGPELTGIGSKHPRTYLLESIVAPNQAIAQGFESVILAKNDGTIVTGVLKSEDDKTVKVMTAEAKLIEVAKADIDERKRGNSAMPEDLPKKLSRSELRDLVEFLAGQR
jgi:quinoprotein glucose dehydrogenase